MHDEDATRRDHQSNKRARSPSTAGDQPDLMGRKTRFAEPEDRTLASLRPGASLKASVIFQTMGALQDLFRDTVPFVGGGTSVEPKEKMRGAFRNSYDG
ncbi:hypothetical protein CSOJ01_15526 [Colletotrichum sojae]|uniref:Uncharacterized protein n=1 Tax=Colletotrichum sojae TaxID=2175907 RepID=A0A8H6IMX4_9PEZI|nr:hypothetical protein CSOJ01_15526 [Colletotrichum sojae]